MSCETCGGPLTDGICHECFWNEAESGLDDKCEKCGELIAEGICPKCTILGLDSEVFAAARSIQIYDKYSSRIDPFTLESRILNCAVCGGKTQTTINLGLIVPSLKAFDRVDLELLGFATGENTELLTKKNEVSEKIRSATNGCVRVKWEIVQRIYNSGKFQANGTIDFWQKFTESLCTKCIENLNELSKKKEIAKALLKEAARLDPDNEVVLKNLDSIS